ncbi:unnamed protein product [Cylicostephanus goldi]|uniref:Ig-like domain-containing protein n=1 Tax=Cylicostephanus goldi TaxID=71465 RepID=A0A3P6RLV0_CYLGO|nr:unnamed protein product [Cylicostephanus goldi]
MNNGSLIVTDIDADTADNLKLYMCKVRGRRKPSIAFTVELEDELPVVNVEPKKLSLVPGDTLQLSCNLSGSPLTTKIEWTKNDQKIIPDEIVQILPNNTLLITTAEEFDTGLYKCIAISPIGSAYDQAKVIVEDPSPMLSEASEAYTMRTSPEETSEQESSGDTNKNEVDVTATTQAILQPTTDIAEDEITMSTSHPAVTPITPEVLIVTTPMTTSTTASTTISTASTTSTTSATTTTSADTTTTSVTLVTTAEAPLTEGSGDYEYTDGDSEHLHYALADADSMCPHGTRYQDGQCIGQSVFSFG